MGVALYACSIWVQSNVRFVQHVSMTPHHDDVGNLRIHTHGKTNVWFITEYARSGGLRSKLLRIYILHSMVAQVIRDTTHNSILFTSQETDATSYERNTILGTWQLRNAVATS